MFEKIKNPKGLTEWFASGTTGASAESIVAHLTGRGDQQGDYPRDSGDFGRCERLLSMVPSLREGLPLMAEVNAYWAALVEQWNDIAASENQTDTIKAITLPIEGADPSHIQMGQNASMRIGGGVKIDFMGAETAREIDEFTVEAAKLVIVEQKCSTSHIQRRFAIGYNRAARIVEALEGFGVVTTSDHVGHRDIVGDTVPQTLLDADATRRQGTKSRDHMKNTPADDAVRDRVNSVAGQELRQFIERYERLEAEKKDIADGQKEVMAEAKGRGYDTKVLRKIMAIRKRDSNDLAEEEAVMEMYMAALGM